MTVEKIAQLAVQANVANGLMSAALTEFNTYCEARDWEQVELARLRVIAHMEMYLDGIAAVHRMIERG